MKTSIKDKNFMNYKNIKIFCSEATPILFLKAKNAFKNKKIKTYSSIFIEIKNNQKIFLKII